MKRLKNILTFLQKDAFLVTVVLIIAALSHGINMFHFPYLENDEGTYISQAWSLLTQGQLAPYTYWYDHAPGGWIFIAVWAFLTGGFFTFGLSAFSGRVFMLVLHVIMSYILLLIGRRLSGKIWPGIIAVLIFSLSPLAIYFQRRILLDNIMIFWVLVSMALLMRKHLSLKYVAASAVTFAFGVLSKENAVFFVPGFLYLLVTVTKKVSRKFAIVVWLFLSGSIVSLYILYAFLKSELWPVGFIDKTSEHVSLITTLQMQIGRGNAVPFWNLHSDFFIGFVAWIQKDPYFIFLAIFVTAAASILSLRNKSIRIVTIFVLFFWLFLLRGKLIIEFYVVPLIPLIGLLAGLVLDEFVQQIAQFKVAVNRNIRLYPIVMCILAVGLATYFISITTYQYTKDETTPQIKTVQWVKKNIPAGSNIIIDDYDYVDLHSSRFPGDPVFENADWFWKLSSDPEIRDKKYQGSWENVQYITLSHEMLKQISVNTQPGLKLALDNAKEVVSWKQNTSSYLNIRNYISTNGDWMGIYKVNAQSTIINDESWNYYKKHFIHSYGQVTDPSTGNTTSEGQSYAMLRAAFLGDKHTFDGVYSWSKDHLQFRGTDKLFSWLWTKKNNTYQLGDIATASDADEDVALSLLIAYQKWHDPVYLTDAKAMINDIWKKDIVSVNGRYYITMGDGAKRPEGYLVNPSYFSPATYRIFAQVDNAHPWSQLASDSYLTLRQSSNQNDSHLPSNWVLVNANTGAITSAGKYMDKDADNYGFDAFRAYFRVALDNTWFPNKDAKDYLAGSYPFFLNEWQKNHKIAAVYKPTGEKSVDYSALSTNTAPLMVFASQDDQIAREFYKEVFQSTFKSEGYWQDPNNYYDQNWSWFATALFTNNLPNSWVEQTSSKK